MSVSSLLEIYYPPKNDNFSEKEIPICSICQESIRKKYFFLKDYFINHVGEGTKHPFHRQCLKENFIYNKNCPDCREPLNEKTIPFSKIDWVMTSLGFIKKNIFFCSVIAISIFSTYINYTQPDGWVRLDPDNQAGALFLSLVPLCIEIMNKLMPLHWQEQAPECLGQIRALGFIGLIFPIASIWHYLYPPPMDITKFVLIGRPYSKY